MSVHRTGERQAPSARALSVLLFLPDMDAGGAQRTFVNLAYGLSTCGITTRLVSARGDGPARAWLMPGTDFVDLGLRRLRGAVVPLRRLVALYKPDAVLSTMLDANIAAYLALLAAPTRPALIVRETNSHRARADIGRLRRMACRFIYRRADAVVALSRGVGRELVADYGLRPSRTITLPNPIDVSGISRQAELARQRPAPWPRAVGPTVVAIGRLHRQKGFDLLIKAFARVVRTDAHLIIIGEGGERATLEALVRELGLTGRVSLPGFVSDVTTWLAHASLFVLSSRWEGFGHVLVEAMACSVPVIATDCPHGPADILRSREDGLLVPPNDDARLGEAMSRVLDDADLRRSLAAGGRIAADRFATARVAGCYAKAITAIVAARARPGRESLLPEMR